MVFAAFMMVERFGFGAGDIALLFLLNHIINSWLAPRIGRFISDWGERRALTLEYVGLVVIFQLTHLWISPGWRLRLCCGPSLLCNGHWYSQLLS